MLMCLSVAESAARLRSAGWIVQEVSTVNGHGEVWKLACARGATSFSVTGESRREAWAAALENAQEKDFPERFDAGRNDSPRMSDLAESLDPRSLQGARLQQISLDAIIGLQFATEPPAEIALRGRWELRRADGTLIERQSEPVPRAEHHIQTVFGRTVTDAEVLPDKSVTLAFDSGHTLRIFGSRNRHASKAENAAGSTK